MANAFFSKGEALSFGWDTVKEHFWHLVVLLIIGFAVEIAPSIVFALFPESMEENIAITVIEGFISSAVSYFITMGFINISLKFCGGEKPEIGDLFSCFPLLLKYLIGTLLYGLIALAGLILLVVPGVIWILKFQFYGYLIVDQEMGPIEALKRSYAITTDVKLDLFLFALMLIGINILGLLALLLGLFATIPLAMIGTAFIYLRLRDRTADDNMYSMSPEAAAGGPTSDLN